MLQLTIPNERDTILPAEVLPYAIGITPHKEPPLVLQKLTSNDINGNSRIVYQPIKLGKYLTKYYPQLSSSFIKTLVSSYKKINANISNYTVCFSTDYVTHYETPLYPIDSKYRSCMTGNESVKVYNYDDRLRLLCIFLGNTLVGRTLCRLDLRQYIRVYLDHNLIDVAQALYLVENEGGFTKGSLEGIRLELIEHDEGGYYCPSLDGDANRITIENDYLLISEDGDIDASNTKGKLDYEDYCKDSY